MINKPYFALKGDQKINMDTILTKNGDFNTNDYHWSTEKYFLYKVEQFGTF